MRPFYKILLHLVVVTSFLLLLYGFHVEDNSYVGVLESWNVYNESLSETTQTSQGQTTTMTTERQTSCLPMTTTETPVNVNNNETEDVIHIWCILTKVHGNINMKYKFQVFFRSLLEHSSVSMNIHIITDGDSESVAAEIVKDIQNRTSKNVTVSRAVAFVILTFMCVISFPYQVGLLII